jgi:hypothetical protein
MDFLFIPYFTVLALHVLGAICTHHQEHKLQSRAVGVRDCYGVLVVGSGCGWNILTLTAQSIVSPKLTVL